MRIFYEGGDWLSKVRYSTTQKIEYHANRLKNSRISDDKKVYSRNWLEGYNDPHYKFNLGGAKSELSARRKNKVPFSNYDIGLLGYENGLRERNKG